MNFILKIPGPLLVFLGACCLSFGGLIVKSFEGSTLWQILFWRSIFFSITILLFLVFTYKLKLNAPELSGGQRQRLSLARILFLKPKILMIDEGLNSLDIKSETQILKNILNYYPNTTLIVSSHRPIKKMFNRKIIIS